MSNGSDRNTSAVTRNNVQNFRALIIFLVTVVIGIVGWVVSKAASGYATNDRVNGVEMQVDHMREDMREMRRELISGQNALDQKLDTLLLKSK